MFLFSNCIAKTGTLRGWHLDIDNEEGAGCTLIECYGTGGGSEGAVVLNVGADEGLIANADAVGIASAGVTKDKLAASGGTSSASTPSSRW